MGRNRTPFGYHSPRCLRGPATLHAARLPRASDALRRRRRVQRGVGLTRPFQQGRFADLPDTPRLPHAFEACDTRDIMVAASQGWPRLRIHVRVFGTGPPLLLIHGLMTSSYSWRYAFELLGKHYTCYAPDLPGAGRSQAAPHADYRPHSLAHWLLAMQRALNIEGCDIIGNSMGGYLAMVMAICRPNAIGRLVNLHSPGVTVPRLRALRVARRIPGARRALRAIVQASPLRWAHRHVHYYDESLKSLEEAREYGAPLATEDGFGAFFKYLSETMDAASMDAFTAELEQRAAGGLAFPVPMLMVYAEADPVVEPAVGVALARRIPGVNFRWLERASHFAHVDAAERFSTIALEFLRSPPGEG